MSHIRIDKSKAMKKWSPVLENMGVTGDRVEWMAEYAEYHSINENAYANASNVSGMGSVLAPQPSTLAGSTIGTNWSSNSGTLGSGDVGQNLLPVAMKIAAQTIGLDLVAVKPSPGPKIDLLYIDFRYDDNHLGAQDERPQVFKLNAGATASALATAMQQGTGATILQSSGGLQNGRYFYSINSTGETNLSATISTTEASDKEGVVEFLGFSRIDGFPMFRAYRQFNTAHTNVTGYDNNSGTLWSFDQTRNTFNPTASMISQITSIGNVGINTGFSSIELVSALEDHIPGFSANWTQGGSGFTGNYPMDRDADDKRYSGIIGPKISSKSVAVGTIEVSSALRRTEIEDIKANTGMDIVQKMESILVNELSQTISKQIVSKIFEMGDLNRTSAPLFGGSVTITGQTIFDLDTDYVSLGGGIGGETTHAVQRKLITKVAHASNYIATEGRVGPAQYLITNGGLAAALQDIAGYTINPVKSKLNASGQLYPVGSIGDISIYVDPYMKYNDNRMVLGRKNNPDQPGIIFVPYLMAQSISVISEATFAPRMLLRSRYAVTEVGWFPQKQFMTIKVKDTKGYLN